MTNSEQDYEMCFRVDNVGLPKGGYFGVSAATGTCYWKDIRLIFITRYNITTFFNVF